MTKYNKGIAAFIGLVVNAAILIWYGQLGWTAETAIQAMTAISAITGAAVYQIPNKPS